MRFWLFLAATPTLVANLGAQAPARVDTIAEARRLRDDNDFAGAAALMRPYVELHPDDPGSARFAALMAYWAKDRAAADSIYGRALANHPDDADLRLEYARFLLETGRAERTRAVLAPFTATDSVAFPRGQIARARSLLGTCEYWRGDYSSARREFRAALMLDSTVTEARRQLAEIEISAASWVRAGTSIWDDDQPLRSATFGAEGGWFVNPLSPLGVRARSTLFHAGGVSESISSAEGTFSSYLPSAHLDVTAAGGVVERSFDASTEWTGRVALGARLPRTVRLDVGYDRVPYASTVRSLTRPIMVQTVDGDVRWGTARGWMGELAGRSEIYPDDNHASTAFGWVLAPVASRDDATFHVGYGFTAQSAASSRFSPRTDIGVPPGQLPSTIPGEYNPYYTPRNLRAHSALAAARLRPNGQLTIEAGGRYAVSAHDDAPVLVAVATPPTTTVTRGFYDRSFNPWNARGSIDWATTRSVHVGVGVQHGREAYYAFTTARVQLTYTFVAAAEKRADLR